MSRKPGPRVRKTDSSTRAPAALACSLHVRYPGIRNLCRSNTRLGGGPALLPALMDAVMVGLPGAAQDRLPADVPGTRPGCPGVPRRPGEGCRAARAPARASQALDRHLPRDASNAPGLASQTGRQQIRHEQAAQARPPAGGPGHRPPGRPRGEGGSAAGTPPDPRRADQARRDGRAVHRAGDPAGGGHRSGAAPAGSDVAAVPARPGRRDRRGRFPARGYRAVKALARAGVHPARHPPDAPGRRHPPPHSTGSGRSSRPATWP